MLCALSAFLAAFALMIGAGWLWSETAKAAVLAQTVSDTPQEVQVLEHIIVHPVRIETESSPAIQVLEQVVIVATATPDVLAAETNTPEAANNRSIPTDEVNRLAKDLEELSKEVEKIQEASRKEMRDRGGASSEYTLVERIVLDRHTPSLYRYWQRQDTKFRREYPWPEFWKETARLNGIANSDTAWKKVRIGTELSVPAGRMFVQHDPAVPQLYSLSLNVVTADREEVIMPPRDSLRVEREHYRQFTNKLTEENIAPQHYRDRIGPIVASAAIAIFWVLIFLLARIRNLQKQLADKHEEYLALGKRLEEATRRTVPAPPPIHTPPDHGSFSHY